MERQFFKRVFVTALFGALAGALNGFDCWLRSVIPYHPTSATSQSLFDLSINYFEFNWHIIPAGAGHAFLLAAIPVAFARVLRSRKKWIQFLAVPLVGYLSGILSWAFLAAMGIKGTTLDWSWGLKPSWSDAWESFSTSFQFFGLVGALFYFNLILWKRIDERKLEFYILTGIFAGVVGSVCFWWEIVRYLALVHGTLWGLLVGIGYWVTISPNPDRTGIAG